MFKKILLSTDLYSDPLITCVAEIKKLGLEEIVLVHVTYIASTPVVDSLEQDARAVLQHQKAELQAKGFRIIVDLPSGLPAPTLASTAEKHDVSLIVLSSHGRGSLSETALFHLTRRPILVFSAEYLSSPKGTCRNLFDHILFATDFSETAEKIIPYAAKISVEMGSMITLFHVLDKKGGTITQEEEGKQFLIEAKRQRLQRLGANNITTSIRHGNPGREICKMAAEGNFSLIFMGSTKVGIVKDVVLGSPMKEVIHHCGVPVMIIPSSAH